MARILLAEDDFNVSIITRLCLEKIGGHEVVVCDDGEAAVAAAISERFDVILLDGMMPKKDGTQVAREIREARITTPIIFLSAKSDVSEIEQFLKLAQGYIAKPFDPQTICARINEILERRSA